MSADDEEPPMPPPEVVLREADVRDVIAYLRELLASYVREVIDLRQRLADEQRRSALLQRFIDDFDRQRREATDARP
jgi:hypothetical protein